MWFLPFMTKKHHFRFMIKQQVRTLLDHSSTLAKEFAERQVHVHYVGGREKWWVDFYVSVQNISLILTDHQP